MEHQAKGQPKLLSDCTLPLTGRRVADLVITDLGVFELQKRGPVRMALTGLADGVTVDEIRAKTGAAFEIDLDRHSAAA